MHVSIQIPQPGLSGIRRLGNYARWVLAIQESRVCFNVIPMNEKILNAFAILDFRASNKRSRRPQIA